jgi:hypothetical protein
MPKPGKGWWKSGIGAQGKYAASQRNFRSALIKQPFVAPPSRGEGVSISDTPWASNRTGSHSQIFFSAPNLLNNHQRGSIDNFK